MWYLVSGTTPPQATVIAVPGGINLGLPFPIHTVHTVHTHTAHGTLFLKSSDVIANVETSLQYILNLSCLFTSVQLEEMEHDQICRLYWSQINISQV